MKLGKKNIGVAFGLVSVYLMHVQTITSKKLHQMQLKAEGVK